MNFAWVEDRLFVVSETVGVSSYDFDFDLHFACSHPYALDGEKPCVLRVGPVADYPARYAEMLGMGLRPVNSPQEHALASELEHWYPLLRDVTPRTRVFDALPSADEIEASFQWPVFLKGSRQTSKHNPELAVIRDRAHYERAMGLYRRDPILHWQKPVVREFVALQPVAGAVPGKVAPSVEYRSFWWHGECVGWGRYWYQLPPYESADIGQGLAFAREAAAALKVPFLVVDFARTRAGDWIIIECNDAQESGHAGVPAHAMWREVLARVADPAA